MKRFRLDEGFLESYKNRTPPFGFGGLGELVYMRTYSRVKEDGQNEVWWETVRRVVEGTYNLQKSWIEQNDLGWRESKAQRSAQEMYDRMFNMLFLPPGRGLWAMGTTLTEERGIFAALNNCGFVSTKDLADDPITPFTFLMDASMLGVGVGFDTLGAGTITVGVPSSEVEHMTIPDSREGWVDSVGRVLRSYFLHGPEMVFDYSAIRAAGLPIKGFGGIASGPEPLERLHSELRRMLSEVAGKPINKTLIVDLMNMIGKCVVAGNVRRTAEIALDHDGTPEYLDLKDYAINPHRADFGWASNNSIMPRLGTNYAGPASRTAMNGEPGYIWLENSQAYGRMIDPPDYRDSRAMGVNPCQPAWAPILTPGGLRTMAEITVGSTVWTEEGWQTVERKASSGVQPVKRYRTTCGSFVGTEYHRIVSHGMKVEVRDTSSIDILRGPCSDDVESLDSQDIMDGLVVGDGGLNNRARGKQVLLYIGEDDQAYFTSEVAGLVKGKYVGDEDKPTYKVHTTIEPIELPACPERFIPERFLRDPNKAKGFLRGLFSANGSVVRTRVTFKTTSPMLRDQVQLLLSSLGIRSYFTTNKTKDCTFENGTYTCRESYDINIMTDRGRFSMLIGFIQPYKQEKLNAILGQPPSKYANGCTKAAYSIFEIEDLGEEEVFNIQVSSPSQKHTYWTGGLNVSNCGEQTLESHELCCLVESFPNRHKNLDDYKRTLKFAYLYAKTVTLGKTHWPETNKVLLRNRRIGCSMSGIAQFLATRGLHEFKRWCDEGYATIQYYDKVYSEWMAIPRSIKTTSIKPSGTVSLLAGATPGVHFPESRFYIRRMRIDKRSNLIPALIRAGYHVEPCVGQEDSTIVVEIPVKIEEEIRTVSDVSMWEQLAIAAFVQRHWADNQVSCTVTFRPEEAHDLKHALEVYQYQLKGVSFLPKLEMGAFAQMPYEAISEERYTELAAGIKALEHLGVISEESKPEMYCDGEKCTI